MRINIKVYPNSSCESILEVDGELVVRVKEKPVGGNANQKVIKLLSKHFNVPQNQIKILLGKTGREKLIEIS